MQKKVLLEVNNLVKKFNGFTAVDHISFNIYEGEITGFLGPNGAGKTTTIQMLLDLITPTSGEIKVFGKNFHQNREEILEKMNFSSAYVTMPNDLKVWENLATFARLYGVKDIRKRINELAEFFNIKDFLPKKTANLSTGQLTRLNIAKSLLNNPRLLLLDEPTASLDPDMADRTRKLLKEIKSDNGITILYTSHNMQEVEEVCDRVIFMNKGKIIDDDTPAALIKKYGFSDLNQVFLSIARGEKL